MFRETVGSSRESHPTLSGPRFSARWFTSKFWMPMEASWCSCSETGEVKLRWCTSTPSYLKGSGWSGEMNPFCRSSSGFLGMPIRKVAVSFQSLAQYLRVTSWKNSMLSSFTSLPVARMFRSM